MRQSRKTLIESVGCIWYFSKSFNLLLINKSINQKILSTPAEMKKKKTWGFLLKHLSLESWILRLEWLFKQIQEAIQKLLVSILHTRLAFSPPSELMMETTGAGCVRNTCHHLCKSFMSTAFTQRE